MSFLTNARIAAEGDRPGFESDANVTVHYALQDGKWVFKSSAVKYSNFRLFSGSGGKYGEEVVARMNKKSVPPDSSSSEAAFTASLAVWNDLFKAGN